jgi:hypothetical protein
MHIIADLWWVWLLGCVVTIAFAIRNQIKRMNNIGSEDITKGMTAFFAAGIVNTIFTVLLVVAIVLHIIDYAKN